MNCVSILKWLFKHKSLQTVFRTKHVSLFGNRYEKSEVEKKKETHQQRSKIPQAVMQHNRGNTNFSNFFPSRPFKKKWELRKSVGWWKEVCFVCCILGSFFSEGEKSVIFQLLLQSLICPSHVHNARRV